MYLKKKKSQTGNTPEIQNKNLLQVSIAVIIKTHIILIINTIFRSNNAHVFFIANIKS